MNKTEKWATASLRIHSYNLNAQEITTALETEPTRTAKKGERKSPRNPKSAVFEEHLWLLESDVESAKPLEDHIAKLVEFIEQKLPALKTLIENCEIDLFCGYSSENGQGGFVLDADLLKRLTIIPVDIMLDIYSSGLPES